MFGINYSQKKTLNNRFHNSFPFNSRCTRFDLLIFVLTYTSGYSHFTPVLNRIPVTNRSHTNKYTLNSTQVHSHKYLVCILFPLSTFGGTFWVILIAHRSEFQLPSLCLRKFTCYCCDGKRFFLFLLLFD